jgi:hypothetical protein
MQKTERRIAESGACCVYLLGVMFLCMRLHSRSIAFKCGQIRWTKCSFMRRLGNLDVNIVNLPGAATSGAA